MNGRIKGSNEKVETIQEREDANNIHTREAIGKFYGPSGRRPIEKVGHTDEAILKIEKHCVSALVWWGGLLSQAGT